MIIDILIDAMKIGGLFERLDQNYLDDLVARAMRGSSNAFAELTAAVGDRQLYYLACLCGDRDTALVLLEQVFIQMIKRLGQLDDPRLFMAWASRLSANAYIEAAGIRDISGFSQSQAIADTGDRPDSMEVDARQYSLAQLLHLPLMESQIMLMYAGQGLSLAEIGGILNLSRRSVKRFIKAAERHLRNENIRLDIGKDPDENTGRGQSISGNTHAAEVTAQSEARPENSGHRHTNEGIEVLTAAEMSHLLDAAFGAGGRKANSIPAADLSSYAVYRKERFTVQRGILAAGLVLFMLLPLCFVTPAFSIGEGGAGTRGLPVYDVNVRALLPVGRVIAEIGETELPVYEAGAKSFTVEPTGNGRMTVVIELINRQKSYRQIDVSAVDSEAPVLTGNTAGADTITLTVTDEGIGVDYRGVYALANGEDRITPIDSSEETGIVFTYPTEDWDIYIPDHLGNTLHLSLKLN